MASENPVNKAKGGTEEDKEVRIQHYNELKAVIEEFGEWSIDCLALSRKWLLPHKTVLNWKIKVVKELGAVDITTVGRSIKNQLESNLRLSQRLIREAKRPEDKARAIRAFNDTVQTNTSFAEAWGFKIKVPDTVTINQGNQEAAKLAAIVKQIEEEGGGSEKDGAKPELEKKVS